VAQDLLVMDVAIAKNLAQANVGDDIGESAQIVEEILRSYREAR
jgi:hypothetical protein